jgi:NAD(P)-dependent dehydrogenase (short-subunit alcohol dehydrogenase family)
MGSTLDGKVALVAGGTEGIGLGIAMAFARAGVRVVVAGRRADVGEEAAGGIRAQGGEARFIRADVSQETDVIALVRATVEGYGRLDCACNNAAIEGRGGLLADQTAEEFDRVVAVNLKGVWLCMKYEITQMLAQGGGAIVNISSANSRRPAPSGPFYSATKAAVVNLTQGAAVGYATQGIRINAIDCGAFRTPMLERVIAGAGLDSFAEGESRFYRPLIPMGRLGRPDEVGAAVVWLCSDDASYVTGHTLAVDGGLVARM